MANFKTDSRIVLTLDAGGTNMVFGAMQGGEYILDPITLPSNANNLDLCLDTMVVGFSSIKNQLKEAPVAISFAFPGPADYPNGIIGGFLPNFPSFRDGVALGPFLQEKFGIPVYINNDGDLYAFGEAIGGFLPEINARLEAAGSAKRYKNLLGYTFGTGFGVGFVMNGELNRGDNSCVETYCLPNCKNRDIIVEDGCAIRSIIRVYGELSGQPDHAFTPKDIFDVAEGTTPGNRDAAIRSFDSFAEVAGDAMAIAVQLFDGLIVVGGGITSGKKYLKPGLLRTLRGKINTIKGDEINRVQMKIYDLDDDVEFAQFAAGEQRQLKIYGTDKYVTYDPQKRVGLAFSKLGASKAISIGAYAFALQQLDKMEA